MWNDPRPIQHWQTWIAPTTSSLPEPIPALIAPATHLAAQPRIHRCDYCGGETPDDARGNCSACGAHRIDRPIRHSQPPTTCRTQHHDEPDEEDDDAN
jgi:hypothetical protein